MADELNVPMRGAVTKQLTSFLHSFVWAQWLEIVRNVSFYTWFKDQYRFWQCFWIKQCWTPASWNHATLFHGCFNLKKSGCKFGLTHLAFTNYTQIVWFYIRSSRLWLYLWLFLSLLHGIKHIFYLGWLSKRWITNSLDEKCCHCMFQEMHTTVVFT